MINSFFNTFLIVKMVNTFNELLVKAKANSAPMNDSGIENNTTNGVAKLLYNATITK